MFSGAAMGMPSFLIYDEATLFATSKGENRVVAIDLVSGETVPT